MISTNQNRQNVIPNGCTSVSPTQTPTAKPTQPPTATPTRTVAPKLTKTKGPQPTPRPAATKAPTTAPSGSSGAASVTVSNIFPMSCLIVFWGSADLKLDAAADGTASSPIRPGTYGWGAFIGGQKSARLATWKFPLGVPAYSSATRMHLPFVTAANNAARTAP